MVPIDPDHFLVFCKTLSGQSLTTDTRKARSKLEVEGDSLIFTPESTGKRRIHPCKYWRAVHEEWERTGSWRPSDYKAVTFNAAYSLAILRRYQEHLPGCHGHTPGSNGPVGDETTDIDKAIERIEQGDAWDEGDEVIQVEVKKPLDKVIPVRLPSEKWEELRQEARELGIGPTTLARIWVLDRLRQKPKPNV